LCDRSLTRVIRVPECLRDEHTHKKELYKYTVLILIQYDTKKFYYQTESYKNKSDDCALLYVNGIKFKNRR